MTAKTVQVKYIEFDNLQSANESKNYPESGLFIVKTPESSDLKFIDKSVKFGFFIIAESIFNSCVTISDKVESKELTNEPQTKYEGDFILEFARILLNRK